MENLYDLQKLFSEKVLINLAEGLDNNFLQKSFNNSNTNSFPEYYELLFSSFSKSYRNDLYYRNLIVTKIFLSRHSLEKSIILNELRIGKSRADLVILNGSSTGYEIKSDVDNLNKLNKQLQNYLQAFDFTYIVLPEFKLNDLENLPIKVGIICLTKNNTLKTIKKAISNARNIDKNIVFNTLRIDEYKSIIKKHYKKVPNVPNTKIYKECKKLFSTLPATIVHKEFINILKNRRHYSQYLKNHIRDFPRYLHNSILNYNYNDMQLKSLYKHFISEE